MRRTALTCLTVGLVSLGALVGAEGHISDKQIESAINARQSHMHLYAFNLATLGGMAKDEIPYDAAAATAAANNIVALSQLSQAGYWLPGSDNANAEDTRALPAIWEEGSDVGQKGAAFAEAALAMQTAAATDLDALKAGMAALGGACGACHKAYRQSNN